MDPEDLTWETLVPQRPYKRKWFHGYQAAIKNARWWANAGADSYVSVYGYKTLIEDATTKGYDRDIVPDYNSAFINLLFLDVDFYDPENKTHGLSDEDVNKSIERISFHLGKGNIRRKWRFTGGGVHCLLSARGPASKVDEAIGFLVESAGARVDTGAKHLGTLHRILGSRNTNHGNYVIAIREEEGMTMTQAQLLELAKVPRQEDFKYGEIPWYFGGVCVEHEQKEPEKFTDYSRKVKEAKLDDVLVNYGLDWDLDFCPAMQVIAMKKNVSNEERLQLIKYLSSVVAVEFVAVDDPEKTASNLFFNLLTDKDKAWHAIKAREVESVFKKKRKFHPYKCREMGLCPSGCADCLEKRYENGRR